MEPAERDRRLAYVQFDFALSPAFDVEWVSPTTWDRPSFIQAGGDHFRLGFTRPAELQDGWTVFACAEVLVDATAHLDDQQFFDFCSMVRGHVCLHMLEEAAGLRDEELEAAVMDRQRRELTHAPLFEAVWARVVG